MFFVIMNPFALFKGVRQQIFVFPDGVLFNKSFSKKSNCYVSSYISNTQTDLIIFIILVRVFGSFMHCISTVPEGNFYWLTRLSKGTWNLWLSTLEWPESSIQPELAGHE